MNSSLLKLLEEVTVLDMITAISLLILLVSILISQKSKLSKLFDKWRKDKNEEEDFHSLVYELRDAMKELAEKVDKQQKDRDKELLGYRDDSIAVREKIYEIMNKQADSISELKETVLDIQKKNSKTTRAELKERIERIYSECHPARVCTDTQFETLKDLIDEYEAHGGDNSFVHTLVEPEMYEWKRVDKLMKRE